jgi:threonine/homoserine/homoserine lactone efflux protein
MTGHQIALLVAAQSVALISPGPAVVAILQKSFAEGRGRAYPYGMGLAFGASLWCLFALAGLSVVFHLVPVLYTVMKVAGACYLLWLAFNIWKGADRPIPPASNGSLRQGFLGGLLLNLSNPKPALFFSAVIVTIFPEALSLGQQAGVYAIVIGMELAFYATVVTLLTLPAVRGKYLAAKHWIDRATAGVLGALGLSLALNR